MDYAAMIIGYAVMVAAAITLVGALMVLACDLVWSQFQAAKGLKEIMDAVARDKEANK